MTTQEKLSYLKENTGRTWGNIAEILGISRQMLNFVRQGERNFSKEIEDKIDSELSKIKTTTADLLYSKENLEKNFSAAYDLMLKHPASKDMIGWFGTAMTEASHALRVFEEGNQQEAKARAYEAQRIALLPLRYQSAQVGKHTQYNQMPLLRSIHPR